MQRNGSVHSEEEEEPRAAKTRAESASPRLFAAEDAAAAPDSVGR